MQMMPRETPEGGGAQGFYTPETLRRWRVSMEVPGFLWWPTWEGPARDTEHAEELARASFFDQWGGMPLTIKAVVEVRS